MNNAYIDSKCQVKLTEICITLPVRTVLGG